MKITVREQRIISILESRGEMSVKELGAILNIPVSTLRKQLADMQDRKLIIRKTSSFRSPKKSEALSIIWIALLIFYDCNFRLYFDLTFLPRVHVYQSCP